MFVDLGTLQALAKQLKITLPKGNELKGKVFICHAKEQILLKLYETLNKSNDIELNFKRQNF